MYKNGLLFILYLLALPRAYSQVSRLTLYEEFTGENCLTCAAVNPGLDAILTSPSNTPLVTFIKWMVPLPSAPTNTWSLYQTYMTGTDWRYKASANNGYGYFSQNTPSSTPVNGINTAPTGLLDGEHQWVFGATSDHPSGINNAVIAAAQSNTSAFSITMNSVWDATFSSLNLSVTLIASANFTSTGALVFRTVMIENEVRFNSPPGNNNEKIFRHVAVGGFPTLENGTSMVPTWTVGQTQTFTLNCVVPGFVRDKSQVALIGFIQDDASKKIAQCAQVLPTQFIDDAKAISALTPSFSCTGTFTPEVVINNHGANTINSLTITPYLDGQTIAAFNWTGSLSAGSSLTLSGNAISPASAGGHVFSYSISGVNGGIDYNGNNNFEWCRLYLVNSYPTLQISEQFSTSVFPPVNWGLINQNNGPGWDYNFNVNGISFTSGTGAAEYDFFSNSIKGDQDELLLPPLNLGAYSIPGLLLNFDIAYAQFSNEEDRLDVLVSDNCGANWINVYSKSGAGLATATGQTTLFIPNANQWRKEVIPINGFNLNNLLIKFLVTNDFGNNLYIDNISFSESNPLRIHANSEKPFNVNTFPNPATQKMTLEIESTRALAAKIRLMDAIGHTVFHCEEKILPGNNRKTLNLADCPPGVYTLILESEQGRIAKKITLTR